MPKALLPSAVEQALRAVFRARRSGASADSVRAWLGERKLDFLREVDILRDLTDEEMKWLKDTKIGRAHV